MISVEAKKQSTVKVHLPFTINPGMDCGSVSIKMVANHFGIPCDIEQIRGLADSESGGCSLTIGLALAARKLGLASNFYTLEPAGVGPSSLDANYIARHVDAGVETLAKKGTRLLSEAIVAGVLVNKGPITLSDILKNLSDEVIPIVLLDWNRITNKSGYLGHFVPIVGWDRDNVLVHQPGLPADPEPFFPINREIFELARKAAGTDEDILFIGKMGPTKINISATTVGITA